VRKIADRCRPLNFQGPATRLTGKKLSENFDFNGQGE
jgi:hypothetical protein